MSCKINRMRITNSTHYFQNKTGKFKLHKTLTIASCCYSRLDYSTWENSVVPIVLQTRTIQPVHECCNSASCPAGKKTSSNCKSCNNFQKTTCSWANARQIRPPTNASSCPRTRHAIWWYTQNDTQPERAAYHLNDFSRTCVGSKLAVSSRSKGCLRYRLRYWTTRTKNEAKRSTAFPVQVIVPPSNKDTLLKACAI